jgi:hypothetical protein
MKDKKQLYYLIFGIIISVISYGYIVYKYDWIVFIPIFGIIYSNRIIDKYDLKNK